MSAPQSKPSLRKRATEEERRARRGGRSPCARPPATPSNLTGGFDRAEGGRGNRIRLFGKWDEVTVDTSGFPIRVRHYKVVVEYSADGTNWFIARRLTIPAKEDADANSMVRFVIKGIWRRLQYRWEVWAVTSECRSASAARTEGSPGAESPDAPNTVTISRAPHGVLLDWEAPDDPDDADLLAVKIRNFVAELYDFEGASKSFTAAASTDKFTATAHGYSDGTKVELLDDSTGLPGGVTKGRVYFVRDAAANDFKLSASSGGSAVDLTSDGAGSVRAGKTRVKLARHIHRTKHKFTVDSTADEDQFYYGDVWSVGWDDDKSAAISGTAAGNSDPLAGGEGKKPKWQRLMPEFTIQNAATVKVYPRRSRVPDDYRIRRVTGAAETPAGAGGARFDILKNGTSIFAATGDMLNFSSGSNDASTKAMSTVTLERGDHLKVECEVANGIADVTIQVILDRVG